jgi:hypothetical protein
VLFGVEVGWWWRCFARCEGAGVALAAPLAERVVVACDEYGETFSPTLRARWGFSVWQRSLICALAFPHAPTTLIYSYAP